MASVPGDPPWVHQRVRASRDAYTSGGPMTIHVHLSESEDRLAGGRGLLWPPLGRLPEHVRGRDALVGRLRELVDAPDGRAHVLSGLGGTGKSTAALRVADIALADGRPVWWVPGVDESSLTAGLLGLAQALGAHAGAVEAAQAGRVAACDVVWERLEAHPGWVLVIDNADDLGRLAVAGRPVRDGNGWVRGSRAGLLIVTSRNTDVRAWGRSAELHPVGWLSDTDGANVLLDLAPEAGDRSAAEALSARLSGLALALHHAGSQLGSPFAAEQTFAGYNASLRTGFPGLLEPPETAHDRDMITRTWEMSLEQLARAGVPQARGLLETLAWFAGAVPIPTAGLDHKVLGRACEQGASGVGAGVEALLSVGLIQTSTTHVDAASGQSGLMLHPLVAETIRHRLGPEAAGWPASLAVDLIRAATSKVDAQDPNKWPIWSAWLPHLEQLLATAATHLDQASLATLAYTSTNASSTLLWAGSYAASLTIAEIGRQHTRRLGAHHWATIGLREQEAAANRYLGNAAAAESLYRDVLADRVRLQGANHPNTLTIRYEIAKTISAQGRAAEAGRLFREVLRDQERELGADHPEILSTRFEIVCTIADQGESVEAERQFREILQAAERALGPDHPNTLTTRCQIAMAISAQGRAAEAERLYRDVLLDEKRVLGADHPDTLTTRHRIAWTVAAQGRAAEAERLYRDVLDDRERVLGPDHPSTRATARALTALTRKASGP